ncbi:hypothetical protein TRVL_05926 [Trypanosoma vivax]|nr:hypothetical protein TRVL_05926 [Trypanosoma vivax]
MSAEYFSSSDLLGVKSICPCRAISRGADDEPSAHVPPDISHLALEHHEMKPVYCCIVFQTAVVAAPHPCIFHVKQEKHLSTASHIFSPCRDILIVKKTYWSLI